MKGNDGMIRTGLKYLRDCLKAGPGEAGRRVREKREDARVRAERERTEPLTPEERKAQEAAARKGGVCFRAVFLPGNLSAETEASLRAQTWPAAEGAADYTVFLEPDGWLHPAALYECAERILETGVDLLYCDDDWYVKQPKDVMKPRFKPDYGPDSLRGCNDLGPFLVCRSELLEEAGAGDYAALDGDGRWDAVIRLAGRAKKVCHIPKVLYYRKLAEGAPVPQPALRRVEDPVEGEPLVSILIPNRDHREDLKRCVDSIREKTAYGNYEIIVIENNSSEAETFRFYGELEKDSRVRVITREGSFNYSAVNNAGFREAKGEYILLLNNDTEVINGGWLREMLMYAQREDVGAVGAKLYYPDGTIQHAGIGVGIKMLAGHLHRGFAGDDPGYYGRLCYAQDVSAVTAACMMIPRRVYEAVGGLDESFSLVFNDVDLCLRIREAGYLIVWTPWAELIHYESKSRGPDEDTPAKKRFFIRETNRFLRRWHRVLEAGDPYYNPNLTRWKEDFSPRG